MYIFKKKFYLAKVNIFLMQIVPEPDVIIIRRYKDERIAHQSATIVGQNFLYEILKPIVGRLGRWRRVEPMKRLRQLDNNPADGRSSRADGVLDAHFATKVGAAAQEERHGFRQWNAAENQILAVVSRPAVERRQPNAAQVSVVLLPRLQMQMLKNL